MVRGSGGVQSPPKPDSRGVVREAAPVSPARPNGVSPLAPTEKGRVGGSPRTPPRRALTMGPDPHFTIRRGLEKAREEQELLDQLRWVCGWPRLFLSPAVLPTVGKEHDGLLGMFRLESGMRDILF